MFQGAAEGMWVHDKFQGAGGARVALTTAGGISGGGSKITVSNLHYGVSDADIIVSSKFNLKLIVVCAVTCP